ncbi:MAG TPA: hypothetical protein VE689_06070 [Candidatus Udaeobacter sp.]|nr:hypothetical protein [Candidatus Udaeobacter sp.]
MRRRKWLLSLVAYLAAIAYCIPVWAQSYKPSRPVEVVVHSAPGGGSDVFARAVVEMVQKEKLLSHPL